MGLSIMSDDKEKCGLCNDTKIIADRAVRYDCPLCGDGRIAREKQKIIMPVSFNDRTHIIDGATLKNPNAKIDKRTKEYRDSLKQ